MANGLVIKRPQTGETIFNASTVVSHARSVVETGNAPGSVNLPDMLRGEPYIIQALPMSDGAFDASFDFGISGSVLSWNTYKAARVLVGSKSTSKSAGNKTFHGLSIKNQNQVVQISGVDQTIQFSAYGSVILTPSQGIGYQPMVSADLTITGINPVLAIRGQNGSSISVRKITKNGNSYTFTLTAQSSSQVALIYWAFDVTENAQVFDTTCGFVLRQPMTGVKTFDSRALIMENDSNTTGAATISRPGRKLAVIQSTAQFIGKTINNPEAGGNPGSGRKWMYQEHQHTTSTFSNDSYVTVGLSMYDWANITAPNNANEVFANWGQARHTIIDVTKLPSAVMPPANSMAVALNVSSRIVEVASGTNATTTTGPVTATASGGFGPYTYEWQYVDGSNLVQALPNGNQLATRVVNQVPGTTLTARWRCYVKDSVGREVYSTLVTFTHIVRQLDVTPDPITFPNQSWSTNDNFTYGAYSAVSPAIAGLDTNIMLRFQVVGITSNASWQNWELTNENHSSLGFSENFGLWSYMDVPAGNGYRYISKISMGSTQGRRNLFATIRVTNLNNNTVISEYTVNITVDADDNYYPADLVPDPITLNNQSSASNEPASYNAGTFFTITGISQQITLRFTRDSLTQGGDVFTRRTIIGRSTNGGASYDEYWLGAAAGMVVDLPANNGDRFFIKGYVDTNSGRAWANWRNIVTNLSTGDVLGSAYIYLEVDADNNYNIPDYTLDNVTIADFLPNTVNEVAFGAPRTFQVTGINRTVQLQLNRYDTVNTGQIAYSRLMLRTARSYNGPNNGVWDDSWGTLEGNGAINFTVNNGDWVELKIEIRTNSGLATTYYTANIFNNSAGGVVVSFKTDGKVDSDNNFNRAPKATLSNTYLDPGHQVAPVGVNRTVYCGSSSASIADGTGPFYHSWALESGNSGWTINNANTATADFRFSGRTSFNEYATFRYTVTDSAGLTDTKYLTCVASAGVQN